VASLSGSRSSILQSKACLKARNFSKIKLNYLGLCSHSCLPKASLGYCPDIL
jgi:hypothetical protein